jgi:hypothetical protein
MTGSHAGPIEPEALAELAAPYQSDADLEATEALLATHNVHW